MRTLYEILEVSETASSEVIEKAYKVLAKKYHPDLQLPENKQKAENKMKQINEAYEVLNNELKRKSYDEQLAKIRQEIKQKEAQTYANQYMQENNNHSDNTSYENVKVYNKTEDMQERRCKEDLRRKEEKMRKQMLENLQREYENAYYNYLRSLGYKIKEKWTWKKTKEMIIVFAIMIAIFAILWFFPPTHKMIYDFYENNKLVKIIVDIIVNIIIAIFKAIGSLFTG